MKRPNHFTKLAPMIVIKIKLIRLPKYLYLQSTHFIRIMLKNGSVLYFDQVFFDIFKP